RGSYGWPRRLTTAHLRALIVISTLERVVAISWAVERSDTPGLELKGKSHPGGMPASIAFDGSADLRTGNQQSKTGLSSARLRSLRGRTDGQFCIDTISSIVIRLPVFFMIHHR